MKEENNKVYKVFFTEEFELCLDKIQQFFFEQGEETLRWWYLREDEIIEYIVTHLTEKPNMGLPVKNGNFKGLRRITYGNSRSNSRSH